MACSTLNVASVSKFLSPRLRDHHRRRDRKIKEREPVEVYTKTLFVWHDRVVEHMHFQWLRLHAQNLNKIKSHKFPESKGEDS